MKTINNLLKCPRCYGMTPRDHQYCVWQPVCNYRLSEKEVKGNVKDNKPEPKKQLPFGTMK